MIYYTDNDERPDTSTGICSQGRYSSVYITNRKPVLPYLRFTVNLKIQNELEKIATLNERTVNNE